VQEIEGLKREGLSVQAISQLTGYDRKTIRKYLILPDGIPVLSAARAAAEQAGCIQALFERMISGRRLECTRVAP
jgi:hypothetical protein